MVEITYINSDGERKVATDKDIAVYNLDDGKLDDLVTAILYGMDWLDAQGIDTKAIRKRRDKREPGRRRKEENEMRMAAIISRMFAKQRRRIKDTLLRMMPDRKSLPIGLDMDFLYDEEDIGKLVMLLTRMAIEGASLFNDRTGVTIDYTMTNAEAARWAREYAYKLVKGITETSKAALQSAISAFVETPGMTIGDLMSLLPYTEERAMMIAVTETTRAYAHGELEAGKALAEQFPDLEIVKTWFTNNDDRVCEICGPLEGTELPQDATFYEPDDYNDGNPPAHVNCRCWLDIGPKV